MRNKLVLLIAVILVGCATDGGVRVDNQKVEVPIGVPCKAKVPPKPDFNFNKLEEDKDVFEKTKALLADRKLHLGYEDELLTALNSCIK